ncbi:MAG TPA: FHA domain-containing protein [Solirubrobacteraceae bacterium]
MTSERSTVGEQTERLQALGSLPEHTDAGAPVPERPAPGHYLAIDCEGEIRLLGLEQEITRVGRGFYCEVRLEDQSVSRRHAIITRKLGCTRILDDRSSNGTFVNGRRVTDEQLHDGDVIVLGETRLGYLQIVEVHDPQQA